MQNTIEVPLIVLKDPFSNYLVEFVERNLSDLKIETTFVDNTDDFMASNGFDQSHVLVIGSEWCWMLRDAETNSQRPNLLILHTGEVEPYESRHFAVENIHRDRSLFQKHVLSWLSDT